MCKSAQQSFFSLKQFFFYQIILHTPDILNEKKIALKLIQDHLILFCILFVKYLHLDSQYLHGGLFGNIGYCDILLCEICLGYKIAYKWLKTIEKKKKFIQIFKTKFKCFNCALPMQGIGYKSPRTPTLPNICTCFHFMKSSNSGQLSIYIYIIKKHFFLHSLYKDKPFHVGPSNMIYIFIGEVLNV